MSVDRRPVFVGRGDVKMVSSVVERATSSALMAPDWSLNMEICDVLNRHPGRVKDAVRSIKTRMGNKKPKVQLLNLTLLETIVKNCGDFVHMKVAQEGLPQEMVKIIKKRPDYQVKEKILSLLDTWQEEFGGVMGRYHQYFAAYQELLLSGTVFPPRPERGALVIAPTHSHPLPSPASSSSNNVVATRHPTMSLSEIQRVRGTVGVVFDMLSAIQPGNQEALRQEALVELVEHCRMSKPKVVHLVNSTVDESLLCQGLTLNDELQRVLSKYESLLSAPRTSTVELDNPKPQPEPIPQPQVSTVPPPDLLSCDLLGVEGDDYDSLALVPISQPIAPQPPSHVTTHQTAPNLVDLISTTNASHGAPIAPFSQCIHQSPTVGCTHVSWPGAQCNGYPTQLPAPSWGAHTTQLQYQPSSPIYSAQNGGSMPPPPWESQSIEISNKGGPQSPILRSLGVPTHGNENQIVGMFVQPITGTQLMALNQSCQMPIQAPASQMMNMFSQVMGPHQMIEYAQEPHYLEQGMYGLSLKDDASSISMPVSVDSYMPPVKQQLKEGGDLLFGDIAELKLAKTRLGNGNM